MKKRLVKSVAGRAQSRRILKGIELIGTRRSLPPANSNTFETVSVGTPNFLIEGSAFRNDMKNIIATGPKSFTMVLAVLFKKRDVLNVIIFIVPQQVASAMFNDRKGIVRFDGSASWKLRRREYRAS